MNEVSPPSLADSTAHLSDRVLLGRLRDGDAAAATEIYERYAYRLRALTKARCPATLASKIDPDDIVQSVFRSFFRKASTGLYDVPDDVELWRLLIVMTLNRLRDESAFLQAAKRDVRRCSQHEDLETLTCKRSHHDGSMNAFLRMIVAETLETLPEQQRQIIQLRLESHDVSEIAAQTGISKRTVERTLQELRNKIRRMLFEDE